MVWKTQKANYIFFYFFLLFKKYVNNILYDHSHGEFLNALQDLYLKQVSFVRTPTQLKFRICYLYLRHLVPLHCSLCSL